MSKAVNFARKKGQKKYADSNDFDEELFGDDSDPSKEDEKPQCKDDA